MKRILLLLFFIFSINTYSQNLLKSLILKDAETNLPISEATVQILRTKQILLSNVDGVVNFTLKSATSIQITHSAYISVTIRSINLKDVATTIYLKSNVNELEEFVFSKQHPQKILKNLVENSKNKLTTPARLKIYAREFFKQNDAYSYYNDGLMNFQIFDKSKKFDTNILVEQNRGYGLINDEMSNELLGYNLNNIMENYYNFKYLNPALDPKARKEYDFLIKVYSANKDYYIMIITPKDENKELLDDYSIIYDNKLKMIIEASTEVSPRTLSKVEEKTNIGAKNVFKSLFKTIYRFDNTNYYLVSSREEIGFNKIEKASTQKIEVRNYMVTTNFSNQNFSFKPSDVFKDKTLFNKKNTILNSYWNDSGLTATKEEQDIINEIDDK
jgi:hypothetical protein